MTKAIYRNQEIFPLHYHSDAISGQTRKSFQIIPEHQSIEKIAISRPELKIKKFDFFSFFSILQFSKLKLCGRFLLFSPTFSSPFLSKTWNEMPTAKFAALF